MIRRLSLHEFYFRSVCFSLPLIAFVVSWFGLRALDVTNPPTHDYPYICALLTLAWILFSQYFAITNVEALFLDSVGVRSCLKAVAWTYMSGFSALFFYRQASYSRLVLGTSALLTFSGILLLRWGYRSLLRHSGNGLDRLRIIIIGADDFALKTSETLKNSLVLPCRTLAFVRIPGQERSSVDFEAPVYELDQLRREKIKLIADEIVIAGSSAVLPAISGLVRQLETFAVPIRVCMDFGGEVKVRDRCFRIGGAQILDVQIAPSETIDYVIVKRGFDIVFSLLALTICAVPMALIAIAIKCSSAGPVLFAQERVGINGQNFKMFKFRTMRVVADDESDTRWTIAGDPRCTAIGALLRRSCLDELPQFVNVLRGEMSVVGPRPERPHFVQKFNHEIDAYNTRHHLKSGITGWAQVNGLRGDTDIAKRVELDLYYLQNWSLAFDIWIILMTIPSGVFARNAY